MTSQFAQVFSRFVNATFLGGSPHQSISARAYQLSFSDPVWKTRAVRIDYWLGDVHCAKAWNFEVDNALYTLEQNGLISAK